MAHKKITVASVLKNLDAIITCVTLSVCVILVNVNVILRYVIKQPIPGCEEIVTGFFVWTVFIGCAYAHRMHAHLGVDILVNIMPGKMKKVVENVMFNLSGAWKPALTDVLRFPVWYIAIAVPIGFGLCTIFSIIELLTNKLHLFKGSSDQSGHTPEQGGGAV